MAHCHGKKGASLSRALLRSQGTALILALLLFVANWPIARAEDEDYGDEDYGDDEVSGGDYGDDAEEETGNNDNNDYSPPSPPNGGSGSRSGGSSSSTPSYSPSGSSADEESTSVWKYVIIAVIVIAVVAAAITAWFCCCRKRSKPQHDIETGTGKPYQQGAFITSTTSPQAPIQAASPAASGPVAWAVAMKRYGSRAIPSDEAWYVQCNKSGYGRVDNIMQWVAMMLGSQQWTGILTYNDQPFGHGTGCAYSDPPSSNSGHCKGIVVWNNASVGWLIHSVPRWPDGEAVDLSAGIHSFPHIEDAQRKKGQSFAWITMPHGNLQTVLKQLYIQQSYVDFCNHPQAWPYGIKTTYSSADTSTHISILALSHSVYHVAKHPNFKDDIYHEALAKSPQLGGPQPWVVQTWTNTSDEYLPNKRRHLVADIERVGFPDNTHCSRVSDHSKWAFATNSKHVFIGDLNRSISQYKRGGGGIVIESDHLHAFMSVRAVSVMAREQ